VYLLLVITRDANSLCVDRTMFTRSDHVFGDRLFSGNNYWFDTAGRATAGCATATNIASKVALGDGGIGSRSLEFKLLTGQTIILWADNQTRVHDVLHKLPGADWLSIVGYRVPLDALVSDIPGNSTLTVRARLRGGGRISMADEAKPMPCGERRAFGFACDSTCSEANCINKIPEAVWYSDKQAFCFPDSKVQVVRGDPLDRSNKRLLVTHSIQDGEIVAVFGNTTAISCGSLTGAAFSRIRNTLLRASTPQRQMQYSVLGHVENDAGKREQVWIIPRADADLAWKQLSNMSKKGKGDQSLEEFLHSPGPPGKGHLANHVCCKQHKTLAIEVVQIKYSATPEGPAALMPVAILRACRRIAAWELGCTSYQADTNTWGRELGHQSIFRCGCCKCQGQCRQASGHSLAMSLPKVWEGHDLFLSTEPLRAGTGDEHRPHRLSIPKAWGDVNVETSSLRRLTVHRPSTAREERLAYLDDKLMNLLSKWGADGRPFRLPTQGQARVMSTFLWKRLNNGNYDLSGSTDEPERFN